MPMTGVLVAIVKKLVPGVPDIVQAEPQYLEQRLLETPSIALEQARREVVRMIEMAAGAVQNASQAFFNNDRNEADLAKRKEDAIDNLQNKITQYLIQISRRQMEPEQANELPVLLHSVNDIERMGDHAKNLAEAAETQDRRPAGLHPARPPGAGADARRGGPHVRRGNTRVGRLRQRGAKAAFESEERLNAMEKQFRESHLRRLAAGDCNFDSGLAFVDCIYNYEKIGDHLVNTAQAVIGRLPVGGGEVPPARAGRRLPAPGRRPGGPTPRYRMTRAL